MELPQGVDLGKMLADGRAKETARVRLPGPEPVSGPPGPVIEKKSKKARKPKGLPKLTEEEFQRQVVEYARLNGWGLIYHTLDSRGSEEGYPDLILAKRRVLTWSLVVAELKVGKRKPTPAQLAWLSVYAAVGVPAFVWYPGDWPEIEEVLGTPRPSPSGR